MFQTPELDIQKELHDLLYTTTDCSPLQMPYIHRQIRRDKRGNRVECPSCNQTENGTVEGIKGCPYCKGFGYMYDDRIITGWLYSFQPRRSNSNQTFPTGAGMEYDKDIRIVTPPGVYIHAGDRIVDVEMDENKRIAIPLKIHDEYLCIWSDRYTSNGSNSEYNVAGLKR